MSFEEKVAAAMESMGVGKPKKRIGDPEARLQRQCIAYVRTWDNRRGVWQPGTLAALYPDALDLHAIPNGGLRTKGTAAKVKMEGALSGVWDLFLPVPVETKDPYFTWHGLYLEAKAGKNTLTPEQEAFGERRIEQGYACGVFRDDVRFVELICEYLDGTWTQDAGKMK